MLINHLFPHYLICTLSFHDLTKIGHNLKLNLAVIVATKSSVLPLCYGLSVHA